MIERVLYSSHERSTLTTYSGLNKLMKKTEDHSGLVLLFPLALIIIVLILSPVIVMVDKSQAEILVGAATESITPLGPVALSGQMSTRISRGVKSPLMANAIALESIEEGISRDQAIMVSCDLIEIPDDMVAELRQGLKSQLTDFNVKKLFVSATHTHTGPVLRDGLYDIPEKDIIHPVNYIRFLTGRLIELAIKAWNNRRPGGVSWALGHAVVGHNRRAVYADGHAEMYGRTDVQNFRNMEGNEDNDVDVIFLWNVDNKLLAVAVNLACPAQENEIDSYIDADFWHEVRESLKHQYSQNLVVLGWTGAAGDQSPHLMYQNQAEERMRQMRGLTRKQEIARRIFKAIEEAYEVAQKEIHTAPLFVHKVEQIALPIRKVSDAELADAKAKIEELSANSFNRSRINWHKNVIDQYQNQMTNPYCDKELHVIRLGDIAICTNPFELFTDYGIRIKARSKALQTFVIQLTGQGGYVPTDKAIRGGGYSAIVQSNPIGPEGGQILVEKTVESINALWVESH